jgi:hypothetical protein
MLIGGAVPSGFRIITGIVELASTWMTVSLSIFDGMSSIVGGKLVERDIGPFV